MATTKKTSAAERPAAKKATAPRKSPAPAQLLARIRSICLRLPEACEEEAWVGTRWMIRKRNFAHLVEIAGGRPPAYARAASSDGPLVVLTLRTTDVLRDVLRDAGPRFFVAEWGTRWGTKVVGVKLHGRVDWGEVETLVVESYRLLAPAKLAAELGPRLPV
jgi:hypothetical protein